MQLNETISKIPMFENFTEKERQKFAKMDLSMLRFHEGDVIFKEGELYSSLYLIVKGKVSINKTGFDAPIALLNPGQVFGEMSFLSKKPRHCSVKATEDALLIRMDDDFFEAIGPAMKDKIIGYLIELLISRLDRMNEAMAKIARFATIRSVSD